MFGLMFGKRDIRRSNVDEKLQIVEVKHERRAAECLMPENNYLLGTVRVYGTQAL
jgi:hypothetical protein